MLIFDSPDECVRTKNGYTILMEIRFANDTETADWNMHVRANPDGGNVFQGLEFAEQKKLSGWTPRFIIAGDLAITAHEKSVFGLGRMWYLPKGPGIATAKRLVEVLPVLKDFAAKNGVFAVKIEPELQKSDENIATMDGGGLVSVPYIQPNLSTVLIDLSPDIDTVLANLNQKSRHAIRRAERDGVIVERVEASEENCQIFYELLALTAEAQGFTSSMRPFEYYREFWQRYSNAGLGQLFLATFEGTVVAGAFTLIFGEKSTYLHGASIRIEGAYGVTHLVQWRSIEWAKEKGSTVHDLCGTPPSDKINDETHRWYGVGRFKTSFHKHVTDYVGAYDLPVKPFQYSVWIRIGERVTKSLRWRAHHESWY